MVRRTSNTGRRTTSRQPAATPVAGETLAEDAPDNGPNGDATAAEETGTAESLETLEVAAVTIVEPEVVEAPSPAIAELEARVSSLKDSLERSRQQEQTLHQKIEDLQAQLIEQNSLVQKLQTNLEKAQKVQAELDQAQKTALQLAEANHKLIEENKTLQQAQQKLQAELSSKKATQLTVQPPAAPVSAPASTATSQEQLFRQRQAANLAHPVFPNAAVPSGLSDQDIGWVD